MTTHHAKRLSWGVWVCVLLLGLSHLLIACSNASERESEADMSAVADATAAADEANASDADAAPDSSENNTPTVAALAAVTEIPTEYPTATAEPTATPTPDIAFEWQIEPQGNLPAPLGAPVAFAAALSADVDATYRWSFGDGSETEFVESAEAEHTYTAPGRYDVMLTVRGSDGVTQTHRFVQAVYIPTQQASAATGSAATAGSAAASMTLIVEQTDDGERVWSVNPDNDTVTVIDLASAEVMAEIAVGRNPWGIAQAADGRVWVVNKFASTITVIDAVTLEATETIALPFGAAPAAVLFSSAGDIGWVSLEALGQLLKLDGATGETLAAIDVGPMPRHLAVDAAGANVYVSRYISPLIPGEATAELQPQLEDGTWVGGEVVRVDAASADVLDTIIVRYSDRMDNDRTARGIPNYLGPVAISPDGLIGWVPSKQDNVARGIGRDGRKLTHDSTVRGVVSQLDMVSNREFFDARIDLDDSSTVNTAIFDRTGNYLFVALEGGNEIVIIDSYGGEELKRFDVGRAPQGLALSADGMTLYVHNFMDRTVSAHDLTGVLSGVSLDVGIDQTWTTVANENLSAELLLGKQHFYDARDPRLAREKYLACASCHNEGGHDGRVWDMTFFGEGVRNTITLVGHGGPEYGRLHWTANFDEVHDFDAQIRVLSWGTGLMPNEDFYAGTRREPLGDEKAGVNEDLDALAAYVNSLVTYGNSPWRSADGSLTDDAVAGRAVFEAANCAACHSGNHFTDSPSGNLHDIGTLADASGERLGEELTGFDTPTLLGLWMTAPYLHDGSAETIADAIVAHDSVVLSDEEVAKLAAFLRQLDDSGSE